MCPGRLLLSLSFLPFLSSAAGMLLIELRLGSETLPLCPERTSQPTVPELSPELVGTCRRVVMG